MRDDKRCQQLRANGEPCQRPVEANGYYCAMHMAKDAEQLASARAAAQDERDTTERNALERSRRESRQ